MPYLTNNAVAIHYRVEGDGTPLVLQHGFADSSESWYELGYVDALKSKYRLILPDTRGHGQSGKPHDPLAYTPAEFASDLVAVFDELGIRQACYWGYSQGGWIGFAVMRYAADRISALVVGGASTSAASAFTTEAGKQDPLIAALRQGPVALLKLYGAWVTPALEQRLRANDAAALIACRQQRLVTEGHADVVGTIAIPTLLYAGAADPIHAAAQQSAAQIAGATFVLLPGLGHIAAMCRTDLILSQVEQFLAHACR